MLIISPIIGNPKTLAKVLANSPRWMQSIYLVLVAIQLILAAFTIYMLIVIGFWGFDAPAIKWFFGLMDKLLGLPSC